jgi:anti-anti-sigma factor
LELEGRFDITQVDLFSQKVDEIIERGVHNILIDCNKMNFVSSAGLRILILSHQKLGEFDGGIYLCGLNANTKRVFEITGYFNLFKITENQAEALVYFGV